MILGFHYHVPVIKKEDGAYYTSGAIGVFIDSIAAKSEALYCFMHTAISSEIVLMDYKIRQTNVVVVEIGPHDLFFKRISRSRKICTVIQPYLASIDIMLIRGPSPLLPNISSLCLKHNLPLSYLLVGDYVKSFEGANTQGWKRIVLKNYYAYNKKMQDIYAKNALVFVNSRIMFQEYLEVLSNVHEIKTTTLEKKDFFLKRDTVLHNPIELLYTGRIEPAKGLDEVIDAMSILDHQGIDTILNLVGWEDKKGYLEHLIRKSEGLNLDQRIVFHGKKQVGIELFSMYRTADIYIIASKGNEGFPRTIWEAMANSLPVIASRIGSIPQYLKDGENVLLVKSGDVIDIAEKIRMLTKDEILRKKLIKNGINVARDNTLENQALNMVSICNEYLKRV